MSALIVMIVSLIVGCEHVPRQVQTTSAQPIEVPLTVDRDEPPARTASPVVGPRTVPLDAPRLHRPAHQKEPTAEVAKEPVAAGRRPRRTVEPAVAAPGTRPVRDVAVKRNASAAPQAGDGAVPAADQDQAPRAGAGAAPLTDPHPASQQPRRHWVPEPLPSQLHAGRTY